MFLIHPTRSIAKKMGVALPGSAAQARSPGLLREWYCNDFHFAKTPLALFVDPETYLPIVMKAAPFRDLGDRFAAYLPEHLRRLGYPQVAETLAAKEHSAPILYAKTQDRRTLGVMVEFVKFLEAGDYLGRLRPYETIEMSLKVSSILVSARGFRKPQEMLAERIGEARNERE